MSNYEKESKKQWKYMKKIETKIKNHEKYTKTMKNDEQERNNNKKRWKREKKI